MVDSGPGQVEEPLEADERFPEQFRTLRRAQNVVSFPTYKSNPNSPISGPLTTHWVKIPAMLSISNSPVSYYSE